jgi:hypothetical protein
LPPRTAGTILAPQLEVDDSEVREFLSMHREPGVFLPGGDQIAERYHRFRRVLPGMCRDLFLDPDKLNFRELTGLVFIWLNNHPVEPAAVGR